MAVTGGRVDGVAVTRGRVDGVAVTGDRVDGVAVTGGEGGGLRDDQGRGSGRYLSSVRRLPQSKTHIKLPKQLSQPGQCSKSYRYCMKVR